MLLRSLPYEGSERLPLFRVTEDDKESSCFSHPDIEDLRERRHSFERLAAIRSCGWTLTGKGDAERLPGARILADFLTMLGVKPALGRVFSPDEARAGAERVGMPRYNLWWRRFGADPNIVGRRLARNGYPHT